jgi:2'-5' RNA ligase
MGRPSHLSTAYDRVWRSFLSSKTTVDGRHDTERWREHAGPYAACIVRVPDDVMRREFSVFLAALDRLSGVRVHPSDFLHIMLQELGYVSDDPTQPDEISPARLEEFALAAIEPVVSAPPIAIALGGANAFHDAVFLEIRGGGPIAQLHDRLFDLAASPHVPQFPYLPHCTAAHFTGTMPSAEAAVAIEPWRSQVFGEFTINEVEVVTLDTRATYPELETYAAIPLGG